MENKCATLQHDFEFKSYELDFYMGWPIHKYKFVCKICNYATVMPHLYKSFYVNYMDHCRQSMKAEQHPNTYVCLAGNTGQGKGAAIKSVKEYLDNTDNKQ